MPIALLTPPALTPANHDLSLEGDEYISLDDAAALAKKSGRTVRRWTEAGRRDRGVLPAAHTIHGVRVRISDLIDYMQPVQTGGEYTRHESRPFHRAEPFNSDPSDAMATFDQLADAVARVVSIAPPLTDAQRERLAVILGGAR